MLLIICHHLVVNSGLNISFNLTNLTFKTVFFQVFGAFGYVGIDCFVLISGYFMITKKISLKKFLKLYLEIKFYFLVLFCAMCIAGKQTFSWHNFLQLVVFNVLYEINYAFTSNYLFLFLLIPFINKLLYSLNQKQTLGLIGVLVFYYCIVSSLNMSDPFGSYINTYNYLAWLVSAYILGAYIRLYPCKLFNNIWFALAGCVVSLGAVTLSIISYDHQLFDYYFLMSAGNKLLAIQFAIFLFLFFKNLKIKPNKFINLVASTTFGVLLIHTSTQAVRDFIWFDLFKILKIYPTSYFYLKAIGIVLALYVVCVIIDLIRIYAIERPFFKLYDKLAEKIKSKRTQAN